MKYSGQILGKSGFELNETEAEGEQCKKTSFVAGQTVK
jgi:hypothetical protein